MTNDIAIVGMSCRFPSASTLEDYWDLCWRGESAIRNVPPHRREITKTYETQVNRNSENFFRFGGFIENISLFDAPFFSITPREAMHMDPRQRLMLEISWEALEDAGIPPTDLANTQTGVFIATLTDDYSGLVFSNPSNVDGHSGAGVAHSVVANRLSYFYDLKGPSMTLDTACSGSLVAAHLACQSLRLKESHLALVGGVNIILAAEAALFFSKAGALSDDGKCKAFASNADGFVRSEGIGLVVLQRLEDAIDQNKRIYAVIKGSAVNQDGRTSGILAPNSLAQELVLKQAFKNASITPDEVQYIEAHGTGTTLGDQAEARALRNVFKSGRDDDTFCCIGSVKTNIGHTEAAAGIAGLIKIALSIYHKKLPKFLYDTNIPPCIPFEEYGLRLMTHSGEWPNSKKPLIAGVSSFGFAGTNAHVVLSEIPYNIDRSKLHEKIKLPLPFLISAQCSESLRNLASDYIKFLSNSPHSLEEIIRACFVHRAHLQCRLAIVAFSKAQLINALQSFCKGENNSDLYFHINNTPVPTKLVFLYSGDTVQYKLTAKKYSSCPAFAKALEKCDGLIKKLVGFSVIEALEAEDNQIPGSNPNYKKFIIFSVQAALTDFFKSINLSPDVVIGYTVGEISAAYAAEIISIEKAINIIHNQIQTINKFKNGRVLLQINLSLGKLSEVLYDFYSEIRIIGINGPSNTIISVLPNHVESILSIIDGLEVFSRLLPGSDVDVHEINNHLRKNKFFETPEFHFSQSNILFLSTLDGEYKQTDSIPESYWYRGLTESFDIPSALLNFPLNDVSAIIEMNSQPLFELPIKTRFDQSKSFSLHTSALKTQSELLASLLHTVCKLYSVGYRPNLFGYTTPAVISLPKYHWKRSSYWVSQDKSPVEQIKKSPPININHLHDELISVVSSVIQLPTNQIEPNVSLISLGLDSMMGLEINNRLEKKYGIKVSAAQILDGMTISQLVDYCIRQQDSHTGPLLESNKNDFGSSGIEFLFQEIKSMDSTQIEKELQRITND